MRGTNEVPDDRTTSRQDYTPPMAMPLMPLTRIKIWLFLFVCGCYVEGMETAMPEVGSAGAEPDLIRRWVQIWIQDCNEFRRWEREELLLKEPPPATVAEHHKKGQLFILTARLLQGLMADTDYSARELRAEVDGKVRQLEEAWDMIHNPMGEEEASAILQQVFPNGPGAGSVA